MSKYFKKWFFWSNKTKDFEGLPRPYFNTDNTYRYKDNLFYLHPKIPVPWQSQPIFNEFKTIFNVLENNEKKVYIENKCSFCGISFNDEEVCIRWVGTESEFMPNDFQGPRVFSDTHPLHDECMRQARIFCPYMRSRPEKEFEVGPYKFLRKNADIYKNNFM